jgi:GNAT superfamily N-acetyltransferase
MIKITQITELPLTEIAPLIEEGEREGFRFLARLRDEWVNGENRFNQLGEALFLAKCNRKIVGVCGLNRDSRDSTYQVGRVRRLYVSRSHRRSGIGRRLIHKVIDAASANFRELTVRTCSPEADQFYRSLGFRSVDEERGTHSLRLEKLHNLALQPTPRRG